MDVQCYAQFCLRKMHCTGQDNNDKFGRSSRDVANLPLEKNYVKYLSETRARGRGTSNGMGLFSRTFYEVE